MFSAMSRGESSFELSYFAKSLPRSQYVHVVDGVFDAVRVEAVETAIHFLAVESEPRPENLGDAMKVRRMLAFIFMDGQMALSAKRQEIPEQFPAKSPVSDVMQIHLRIVANDARLRHIRISVFLPFGDPVR